MSTAMRVSAELTRSAAKSAGSPAAMTLTLLFKMKPMGWRRIIVATTWSINQNDCGKSLASIE